VCDLILIVIDALNSIKHKALIEYELEGFGIRLNKSPPAISLKRKEKGGINFMHTVPLTHVDRQLVLSVMSEYKIHSADICFREDCTIDELIDVIEGNRIYTPCVYVLNKIDQITMEELDVFSRLPHHVMISAYKEWNLDELLETIWEYLDLIRIYTKPKGQIPDYNSPVILKSNASIEDFCLRIHKGLLKQLRYALVWGSSVKHNPQKVGKDHFLHDEDIVQLVKR